MSSPAGVDRLLADARAQTGLDDFGDPSFHEALQRLVAGVEAEGSLDDAGYAAFRADLTRLLRSRLAVQHAVTARPEILAENVDDPIVITGLARTGTTKLHRVLATDPGLQKVLTWQALCPAPLAPPGTDPDPRVALAEQQVATMLRTVPDLLAAHPLHAHEPEEEALLMQPGFRTLNLGWACHAPSYVQWVIQQDKAPVYAELRRSLQYLQWQDGGRRGRPWVLKAPIHLGSLEHLLAAFPAATVVHCHRDLDEVVPSIARFAELVHDAYGAPHTGPYAGQIALSTALHWQRNLAARRELDPGRLLDVGYTAIREDVASVVAKIRAHHGLAADGAAADRIHTWEHGHPQHANGRHHYTLQRYGLTSEDVATAFAGYLARFPDPSAV